MRRIPEVVRKYIYERDEGRCRLCQRAVTQGHVHHIYHRYEQIPKKYGLEWIRANNHPANLILLCPECHARIHSSGSRELKERLFELNRVFDGSRKYPSEVEEWLKENSIGSR